MRAGNIPPFWQRGAAIANKARGNLPGADKDDYVYVRKWMDYVLKSRDRRIMDSADELA